MSNCGICFDEFTDSLEPIKFSNWIKNNNCKCNIEYHKNCLIEWEKYKKYKQCPMCRIKTNTIINNIFNNTDNNDSDDSDFIDVLLTYITKFIDDYIFIYITDIGTYNIYSKLSCVFIRIIISFVFTIFIFIPCIIIKYIIKRIYH